MSVWVHAFPSSQLPVSVRVVVAVDELFAEVGSEVVVETVAVFVTTVPFPAQMFARTTSVKAAVPLAGRLAIEQLTVPVPPTLGVEQDHPTGEASDW